MSMLLSFAAKHLLPVLEAEFVAHEPAMQDALLKEVAALLGHVESWLNDKIAQKKGVE